MRRLVRAAAIASIALVTTQVARARSSVWLLIPGKQAGTLRLQSYPSGLPLGKPAFSDDGMSHYVDMWVSKERNSSGMPVNTVVTQSVSNAPIDGGPGERVESIRVTSPCFRTRGGIGPGSTYAAIRHRYPHLSPDSSHLTVLADDARGVAFEFGSAHPRGADRCIAVSIFRKGDGPLFDAKQVAEMLEQWKKSPAQ